MKVHGNLNEVERVRAEALIKAAENVMYDANDQQVDTIFKMAEEVRLVDCLSTLIPNEGFMLKTLCEAAHEIMGASKRAEKKQISVRVVMLAWHCSLGAITNATFDEAFNNGTIRVLQKYRVHC